MPHQGREPTEFVFVPLQSVSGGHVSGHQAVSSCVNEKAVLLIVRHRRDGSGDVSTVRLPLAS